NRSLWLLSKLNRSTVVPGVCRETQAEQTGVSFHTCLRQSFAAQHNPLIDRRERQAAGVHQAARTCPVILPTPARSFENRDRCRSRLRTPGKVPWPVPPVQLFRLVWFLV